MQLYKILTKLLNKLLNIYFLEFIIMNSELIRNLSDEERIEKLPAYISLLHEIITEQQELIEKNRKIQLIFKHSTYFDTIIYRNRSVGYSIRDIGKSKRVLDINCTLSVNDIELNFDIYNAHLFYEEFKLLISALENNKKYSHNEMPFDIHQDNKKELIEVSVYLPHRNQAIESPIFVTFKLDRRTNQVANFIGDLKGIITIIEKHRKK